MLRRARSASAKYRTGTPLAFGMFLHASRAWDQYSITTQPHFQKTPHTGQ
jgi:hypothetical protein